VASSDPVYLRVVEDLRRQIIDSTLPPGAPIPSRVQLTQRYGVGETAARHALRVLAQEGLIVGRVGAGHYVREQPMLLPLHRSRFHDHQTPFAADLQALGHRASWDWRSESVTASPDIARRLRLPDWGPVMCTRYVFRGDGHPLQLATSYEPAEFSKGQPLPDEGTNGRKSLIARMAAAGVKITEISEEVHVRVPRPEESDLLELPAGTHVMQIERTHWSGERPVETSDTVVPGDKFRLVYAIPPASADRRDP
jgi:GntR family transcriptional regulator